MSLEKRRRSLRPTRFGGTADIATTHFDVIMVSKFSTEANAIGTIRPTDGNDLELAAMMRAAQAGDKQAYASLLRACEPIIRRAATRAGVRGEAIEDVLQETLLTLHNARHAYDPSRSFTAWLTVIAQRRGIDALRRSGRTARREINAPLAYERHADAEAQADRGWVETVRARELVAAIATLTPGQREAVEHLALHEETLAEGLGCHRQDDGRAQGQFPPRAEGAAGASRARWQVQCLTPPALTRRSSTTSSPTCARCDRWGSPLVRAAGWLAVVIAIAVALAAVADLSAMRHRLMAVPDMWLAVLGSTLTAGLAAVAAFQLDLPDRSRRWGLLPLPGLGPVDRCQRPRCARAWLIPGVHDASMKEAMHCLAFIICLSIPLSLLIVLMLRRGFTLAPSLTGACAGLAVAAAAATLLNFFHPFDAAATDLAVHAFAVGAGHRGQSICRRASARLRRYALLRQTPVAALASDTVAIAFTSLRSEALRSSSRMETEVGEKLEPLVEKKLIAGDIFLCLGSRSRFGRK